MLIRQMGGAKNDNFHEIQIIQSLRSNNVLVGIIGVGPQCDNLVDFYTVCSSRCKFSSCYGRPLRIHYIRNLRNGLEEQLASYDTETYRRTFVDVVAGKHDAADADGKDEVGNGVVDRSLRDRVPPCLVLACSHRMGPAVRGLRAPHSAGTPYPMST